MIKLYYDGYTEEQLVDVMSDLCTVLEIQPGRVCRGLVEMNAVSKIDYQKYDIDRTFDIF